MRKLLFTIFISVAILGCAINKKPVFLKVDDIKLLSLQTDTIRLSANAYFENPNDVGGKITTDEIKVIVNGAEVAQVSSDEFKVPSKKEFAIPLKVVIPAKRVFDNNKQGVLGGLLNSLINRSIKVQFKGEIKYKVLGFSKTFPIDKTQELKIR